MFWTCARLGGCTCDPAIVLCARAYVCARVRVARRADALVVGIDFSVNPYGLAWRDESACEEGEIARVKREERTRE